MLRDGEFLFSPSHLMTEEQWATLAQYEEDPDYQYNYDYYQYHDDEEEEEKVEVEVENDSAQLPLTEDNSYDPYDELFTVTGYDLPAFGNEVYDSENSSYNIVRF